MAERIDGTPRRTIITQDFDWSDPAALARSLVNEAIAKVEGRKAWYMRERIKRQEQKQKNGQTIPPS